MKQNYLKKEEFSSNLNLEDITDYMHVKRVISGLAWQVAFKNTEIKLDLFTDIDILLMVKKGGICHTIHSYTKANNKYMKDHDKNKKSSYLNYWNVNDLYGQARLQKHSVNSFEWIEETSQFNKDFTKNYNEERDEGYFLEVHV